MNRRRARFGNRLVLRKRSRLRYISGFRSRPGQWQRRIFLGCNRRLWSIRSRRWAFEYLRLECWKICWQRLAAGTVDWPFPVRMQCTLVRGDLAWLRSFLRLVTQFGRSGQNCHSSERKVGLWVDLRDDLLLATVLGSPLVIQKSRRCRSVL